MEHVFNFGMTAICFGKTLLTAKLISYQQCFSFLSSRQGRYGSIDGLRGFLSISVLFHHFVVTWYWKVNGTWLRPPEDYYQNYGKVSVAIFFMITGFLFISKIINDNGKINWLEFYESRIFRVYPLYIAILLIITIIVFSSDFKLHANFVELVKQYTMWIVFYGSIINNFPDTKIIIALVHWTLRYELIFYIFLPILSVVIIKFKQVGGLFVLVITLILFMKPIHQLYPMDQSYFLLFAIGGVSAHINNCYKVPASIMKSNLISSLALLSITCGIFYPRTLDLVHVMIISVFFILVVLGNDLFGVFSLKSSILLGEISYSIYLLHGIILYLAFSVFNIATIKSLSLQEYLIFMPLISCAVIFLSAFTFILIEKPSINFSRKHLLSKKIRSLKLL